MQYTEKMILQSSLGRELSDNDAAVLGKLVGSRDLAEGEFLFEEGTVDDSLYVLTEGKLEVIKGVGGDDVASLAILKDGDLAGELSFIDGQLHTVSLRALCASQVLCLQREKFEGLVDSDPRVVYKVMRAVARSVHRIVHRMNSESIELSNYIFKQHGRY